VKLKNDYQNSKQEKEKRSQSSYVILDHPHSNYVVKRNRDLIVSKKDVVSHVSFVSIVSIIESNVTIL
jgi:hypothetical protein